jgi:hypothetical protein
MLLKDRFCQLKYFKDCTADPMCRGYVIYAKSSGGEATFQKNSRFGRRGRQ